MTSTFGAITATASCTLEVLFEFRSRTDGALLIRKPLSARSEGGVFLFDPSQVLESAVSRCVEDVCAKLVADAELAQCFAKAR